MDLTLPPVVRWWFGLPSASQIPHFAESLRVMAPERQGHGHTADAEGPLSYVLMAEDIIGFSETVVGGPAHIVGWSDGGIVGFIVAMVRPDVVRKLVAVSANFDTSGPVPEAIEEVMSTTAGSDDLAMFRTAYEAAAPDGPQHWPVVFAKFQAMVSTQPNITATELGRISAPTLVLAGDDDLPPQTSHDLRPSHRVTDQVGLAATSDCQRPGESFVTHRFSGTPRPRLT